MTIRSCLKCGGIVADHLELYAGTPCTCPRAMTTREELVVPVGEVCWLIEQTSNQNGKRGFWNGYGFGWDALKAARYPDKKGADEVAFNLNGRNGDKPPPPHGRAEVCEHMFQCGISDAKVAAPAAGHPTPEDIRYVIECLRRRQEGGVDFLYDYFIKMLEPALNDVRTLALKYRDAEQRLAQAEQRIAQHNADCASVCGVGEQEGVRCGYRPYFPRHCPECPRDWMIDSAALFPTGEQT